MITMKYTQRLSKYKLIDDLIISIEYIYISKVIK